MKRISEVHSIKNFILIFFCSLTIGACDRSSSPEGRMSLKIEHLQKELIDSLKTQNNAILDSLSKIRMELNEIKQLRK